MNRPAAYIIVVNYNGWTDTIECLESLLRSDHRDLRIVVLDNASTDGSVEKIEAWASGELLPDTACSSTLRHLSSPPVIKPLACRIVNRSEAEAASHHDSIAPSADTKVTVIAAGDNLGYAGGVNLGIRYAVAQGDLGHVWILNNDTVVEGKALSEMVDAASGDRFSRPVGSMIFDYGRPEKLQAYGGFRIRAHFVLRPFAASFAEQFDYVSGASILLSKEALTHLGLMDESLFLNSEDLEYTYFYGKRFRRAHPGTDPFLVAGKIWHKESMSQGRDSFLHAYYFTRNILVSARRISSAGFIFTLMYAFLRGVTYGIICQAARTHGIFRGIADFMKGTAGRYHG